MGSIHENLISAEEVMRRVRMRLGVQDVRSDGGFTTAIPTDMSSWAATVKAPTRDFITKSEYVVGDFTAYDDLEFVVNAYRAILRREPDDSAGGYLKPLRAGEITKIEVLGALRWSSEGLSQGVHIDGLLLPYKLQEWRRIPVLGKALRWLLSLVRLPRHLWAIESHFGTVSGDLQYFRNSFTHATNRHEAKLKSLERAVEMLPGTELVGELRARIDSLAEQMAANELLLRRGGLGLGDDNPSAIAADLDPLYAEFENQFRGSQEVIRARLQPYLKFVNDVGAGTDAAPILDLGCGRGEWLEMLKERGLHVSGVDLNRLFVEECKAKGLHVELADAIGTLRALSPASVGIISLLHLAEHLNFQTLIELLDQANRVLVPGGGLIIETPNPENALVAQWAFYMDPTHRNPLPPEMLRWMVQARGFAQADIVRLFDSRPSSDVAFVPEGVAGAETINALVRPLHAAMDYAIVARKSVSVS